MGKVLDGLVKLQSVERQLADVRNRLRRQNAAVTVQQQKVDDLKTSLQQLSDHVLNKQKNAGGVELELKSREAEVAKLRTALNSAKTNKEYAAFLTQINTIKADNSKIEDQVLKAMQDVDQFKTQVEQVKSAISEGEKKLTEIKAGSSEEVKRLETILADLTARRKEAAKDVPADVLSIFDRMASAREGDAMAMVEVQGKKAPFEYVCGGCYMSLNAEHANALRTRDELRFCDCCGRILYLDANARP
jgi:predicted  nucleic acid-binding Zn-ribbon protein